MTELSSQAVETGSVGTASSVSASAAERTDLAWTRRGAHAWRFALLRRMLALADLIAGFLASLALVLFGSGKQGQLAWALLFLPAWVLMAKILGLYDRDQRPLRHLTVDEAPLLILFALTGTSCLSFFLELTPVGWPSASSALAAGVIAAVASFLRRALARRVWRAVTPPGRLAVIGPKQNAAVVERKLALFPELHLSLVEQRETLDRNDGPDWLRDVDRLVFAPSSLDEAETRTVIELARSAGIGLNLVPPCHSIFGSAVQLNHVAELPVLNYGTGDLSRSTLFLKRAMDVGVSTVALTLLWPVFCLIALAIKLDSRGSVFFSQLRAGREGRPFRVHKFRSMCDDAEQRLESLLPFDDLVELRLKVPNDPRVTRVGRFLRRWSLDELPQLVNVLKGEMSLVGPRPEQLPVVKTYDSAQLVRLKVKPGMTGPMQVFGRGDTTWDERLMLERDYVENLSLLIDLRILGLTVAAVLHGRGAS